MFGITAALRKDKTRLWSPKPIFEDLEDGCLVFLYGYSQDKLVIKETLIKWMADEGFTYLKDYTIDALPYRLAGLVDGIEDAHGVAVFFKDPQSFVMMKLKYG